jgi:hypothetical protein
MRAVCLFIGDLRVSGGVAPIAAGGPLFPSDSTNERRERKKSTKNIGPL